MIDTILLFIVCGLLIIAGPIFLIAAWVPMPKIRYLVNQIHLWS